jgi:hypothetical protein
VTVTKKRGRYGDGSIFERKDRAGKVGRFRVDLGIRSDGPFSYWCRERESNPHVLADIGF